MVSSVGQATIPAITVLFNACPLGNDGLDSYGGTASATGGRLRPTTALPTTVINKEPATVMIIKISGVPDRHRQTISKVIMDAMIVMPVGPPR